MLRRILAAVEAGRRAGRPLGVPPPVPRPSASQVLAGWALIDFGDPADVAGRLAAHHATCRARGFRCLLLSDDIPGACVGSPDILFEFLPRPQQTALSTPGGFAAATDHTFQRLSHILSFWQVVGCDWGCERALALIDLAPDWAHPLVLAHRGANGMLLKSAGPC